MRQFKIIVEKHPDGYVAYPLGLKGVVVGEGDTYEEAVFFRDNYTCQYCGVKEGVMTVDHIIPKKLGGKDNFKNLVTACWECNHKKGGRTASDFGFPELKGADFSYPAILNAGKGYIFEQLSGIARTERCYGWETKVWRRGIGLGKGHPNDAIAIASKGEHVRDSTTPFEFVAKRRRRDWFNLKLDRFKGFNYMILSVTSTGKVSRLLAR